MKTCKGCGVELAPHWADANDKCGRCIARDGHQVESAPVSWAAVRAAEHAAAQAWEDEQ